MRVGRDGGERWPTTHPEYQDELCGLTGALPRGHARRDGGFAKLHATLAEGALSTRVKKLIALAIGGCSLSSPLGMWSFAGRK